MTLLKFKASPYEYNFVIENHFSLAKWPPLLSEASSASATTLEGLVIGATSYQLKVQPLTNLHMA